MIETHPRSTQTIVASPRGHEDNFDFTTVFYDCFWSCAGDEIVLIGPPLLNLAADLDLAIVAYPSMEACDLVLRHVFLGCQIVLKPPSGTTGLIITTARSESFIAPQPNLCELFRNRRTAVTLSRNNELAWISDWVVFNKQYHNCDGILLYDNNSDAYGVNDIYDCLGPVADGMQVLVLTWPFKYGSRTGACRYLTVWWIRCMPRAARWSTLATASSRTPAAC